MKSTNPQLLQPVRGSVSNKGRSLTQKSLVTNLLVNDSATTVMPITLIMLSFHEYAEFRTNETNYGQI